MRLNSSASKLLSLTILMGSLLAIIAHVAHADNLATVSAPECRVQSRDVFDKGWKFSEMSQSFAGECVNAKSVRPVVVLKKTPQLIEFANFYHQNSFWKARWDKNNIPRVSFLIVHFDGGGPLVKAAHTEFLFRFPRPIELRSQISGKTARVKDVIMSWEAVFKSGGSYSFITGLQDNYPIAGRFTSLSARIPENFPAGEDFRKIERFDLDVSALEARYIFQQLIVKSDAWKYDRFYNTFTPNCTTQPFDILDLVLERTRPELRIQKFYTEASLDPIVGPSKQALIGRQLIKPGQEAINFTKQLGLESKR